VDDTIEAFEWLQRNENTAESIFDAESFRILKQLHESYGIGVSCFCFYRRGDFTLAEVPGRWREEFQENSGWLRFGFHGYDERSNYNELSGEQAAEDFDLTTRELVRITGGGGCMTPALRLHFCSGNEAVTAALAARGIKRLFCGDDKRINYGLPPKMNGKVLREGAYYCPKQDILFSATHVRLEKMRQSEGAAAAAERIESVGEGELAVFTHECYLADKDVMKHLENILGSRMA